MKPVYSLPEPETARGRESSIENISLTKEAFYRGTEGFPKGNRSVPGINVGSGWGMKEGCSTIIDDQSKYFCA